MSVVYKGQVIDSELSKNSFGGTEMMRERLIKNVDPKWLEKCAIHFSRPRQLFEDVINVLYCHDLAEDPENNILANGGWKKFDHIVFVSAWQRDQYITRFDIPYSHTTVIYNAVETQYEPVTKDVETIRFIYHTTPHRGLELLVPIFDTLAKHYPNIHLDVFSSFGIYGWEQRDEPFKQLFKRIEDHPNMTYHGHQPNDVVLEALKKSHIFLYPNVWKETSCIAMIEAIKNQVICIHPNYGALTETAANATIVYEYNEDPATHANYAFSIAAQVLKVQQENPNYFNRFTYSDRYNLARNNIDSFTNVWNQVLSLLVQNAESKKEDVIYQHSDN